MSVLPAVVAYTSVKLVDGSIELEGFTIDVADVGGFDELTEHFDGLG